MPGGTAESYESLGPLLESIAAHVDGTPCCTHVGPDGAGHFVKMVHNGIEYADMQLIAEAYDLLRRGLGMTPAEIADVFRDWNTGDLESFLIEITAEVLAHTDAATGKPFVDVVLDQAEQKGTGRWTVQTALDLGVPVSGIAEAVFARSLSGHAEQRAAARRPARPGRRRHGRPATASSTTSGRRCTRPRSSRTRRASTRSRRRAPSTAGTSTAARWRRSGAAAASSGPGSSTGSRRRTTGTRRCRRCWSTTTSPTRSRTGRRPGAGWSRPPPGSASRPRASPRRWRTTTGCGRERLPAALIQGLRDLFGAHTYRRIDRDGVFHTLWSADRTEVSAG